MTKYFKKVSTHLVTLDVKSLLNDVIISNGRQHFRASKPEFKFQPKIQLNSWFRTTSSDSELRNSIKLSFCKRPFAKYLSNQWRIRVSYCSLQKSLKTLNFSLSLGMGIGSIGSMPYFECRETYVSRYQQL